MSKPTPGPWKVSSSTMVIADDGKLKMVCNTFPLLYFDVAEENISIEQATSNARLIAAAPDLLEAAKALYKDACTKGGKSSVELWENLEKAIRKAVGDE